MYATPTFEAYGGPAPENYERYFVPTIGRPLADDLVDAAALRQGERVLDVACGTGIVARCARDVVGPEGTVAAVDVNPGMIDVARTLLPAEAGVAWHVGPAEHLPLAADSYDVVLCQFGLQFFSDRPAALSEARRVLRCDGRFAANTPGPMPALFGALRDALAEHVAPEAAMFVDAVFALDDPNAIGELVVEAGFEDVAAATARHRLPLPPLRDFLWQYVWSTPLAAAVTQVGARRRSAFEETVLSRLADEPRDGELVLELDVVTVTARKRR